MNRRTFLKAAAGAVATCGWFAGRSVPSPVELEVPEGEAAIELLEFAREVAERIESPEGSYHIDELREPTTPFPIEASTCKAGCLELEVPVDMEPSVYLSNDGLDPFLTRSLAAEAARVLNGLIPPTPCLFVRRPRLPAGYGALNAEARAGKVSVWATECLERSAEGRMLRVAYAGVLYGLLR